MLAFLFLLRKYSVFSHCKKNVLYSIETQRLQTIFHLFNNPPIIKSWVKHNVGFLRDGLYTQSKRITNTLQVQFPNLENKISPKCPLWVNTSCVKLQLDPDVRLLLLSILLCSSIMSKDSEVRCWATNQIDQKSRQGLTEWSFFCYSRPSMSPHIPDQKRTLNL